MNTKVKQDLLLFILEEIIPLYDTFDAAHNRSHVQAVIDQSIEISKHYDVDIDMVYTIAAYHDTGLSEDRKTHHLVSGRIIRTDLRLQKWFNPEQIEIMAKAVEDHRASGKEEPRSIYGKIVAEADRQLDATTVILRTIQYGLKHYPNLDIEAQKERCIEHLREKYGDGGYLKLWLEDSPNTSRLEKLRSIIRNESMLRDEISKVWNSSL